VNLLDENIPADQRDILSSHGIRCRVIGGEIAWLSISDDSIIPLLLTLSRPAFFTRDRDFFKRMLRHDKYTLVWLDARPEEAAMFIRRFLRHPRFRTNAARMGTVVRVHHDGIQYWERGRDLLQRMEWPHKG
jgi:hypothetical protein